MTRSGGFGCEHPREDTELETCVLGETDRPEMDIKKKDERKRRREKTDMTDDIFLAEHDKTSGT